MTGVRPATAARNAAKVGGGSPDPLIRSAAISAAPLGRDRARGVGQAIQRFVMKNKSFAVAAQLNVAFDGESAGDRRLPPIERVFDHPLGLIVQAAMGDRTLRRARRER